MATVRLNVYMKDKQSDQLKKIIGQVNPNCSDQKLLETVTALNNLTTNTISEVWKAVEKNLLPQEDDVTVEDIQSILDGDFSPLPDDDPVSESDVLLILEGNFEPIPDEDTWSADDFVF